MLAAALDYAVAGLPVLPLDGKVPRNHGGLTNATTDVAVVADWWRRWPTANIGIRTGAASGYVVLDVDVPAGLRSLKQHGEPTTAAVLTGSGGYHHWFKYPGRDVRNSAGRLGEGLDVRGDGGYVVAPPSVHASGRSYKWLRRLEQAEECPDWLLDDTDKRNGNAPPVDDVIPRGRRDDTLASLAGTMRRRGMGEAEILAALQVVNRERCRPPLPDRDVERIARSVATKKPEQRDVEPFELSVQTARALCALPDPPGSDELLGPLLVRGQRVILGGHTGEGKTTLALQILRAVVCGEQLLDWHGSGNLRALVIDAEQGLKTIKRRLREAGLADSDQVDYVRVPDGLELDSDERHVAEVERVLTVGGYALVICDPLYKLHAGDSNAEREAVDLMRRFDAWRERLRFALLLPVHCRKPVPGTKFSIHDLFGSSAYVRGAEVVLGLQRVRDGYSKLHFLKDRDGDLPIGTAWGLLFDREHGFERDPDDGKREPTAAEQVRELLEESPWMTKEQLIESTGKKLRTIEGALRELDAVAERRGGSTGPNVYALPDTVDSQSPRIRLAIDDET